MFYKKNISLLGEEIEKKLDKVELKNRYEFEKSKIEEYFTCKTMADNGSMVYLHSKYNPIEEGKKFAEEKVLSEYKNYIIAGFGLGYHIKAFVNKMDEKSNIFCIITNPEFFKIAIDLIDFKEIFSDKRVKIVVGENYIELVKELKQILGQYDEETMQLVIHPASIKTMPKEFIKLRDIFEMIDISVKTNRNGKELINKNIHENMEIIKSSKGINEYSNLYRNMPAFIISAGPSLNKNIDELKNIGQNGLVIAVGTVVRKIMAKEITPDFIVAIDGLENVKIQLQGVSDKTIPLLYTPGINCDALKAYKGLKIVAFPDGDDSFDKMDLKLNKGKVESGGSVATVALDCAYKIGANPIIFVGQDLAISEKGNTHADGTQLENYVNSHPGLRTIEGYYGGYVATLKNLYFYLKWIEKYIERHPDVVFINATEGGANIEGALKMPLRDVIKKYCK